MWDQYLDLLVHCITCTTCALTEIQTSFWHRCRGWYSLVWINILEKEKFGNLRKKISYFLLFLIWILHISFFFLFFLHFFCKVLRIMSNEEINELFYSLQQEFASRAAQIAPTWDDIVPMQAQTPMSQQVYNF